MTDLGPIPDPRDGRFETLIVGSRVAVGVALGLALAGLVVPDPLSGGCAVGAIVVVMVAPLLRVGWLAVRWFRRGDRRFGWAAVGVLGVVATAVLLASL